MGVRVAAASCSSRWDRWCVCLVPPGGGGGSRLPRYSVVTKTNPGRAHSTKNKVPRREIENYTVQVQRTTPYRYTKYSVYVLCTILVMYPTHTTHTQHHICGTVYVGRWRATRPPSRDSGHPHRNDRLFNAFIYPAGDGRGGPLQTSQKSLLYIDPALDRWK